MSSLAVRSLSRSYPGFPDAVAEVSFDVPDGHVAALIGPSGCGKTSLLRLIAGLDAPDRGDVLIDGASVARLPPERRSVGLMFQDLALFPHLTVAENVEFGLRMSGWKRDRRQARVRELLRMVGLEHLGGRAIDRLSGGERQRVALVRTLAPGPAVVLLDEPLGALDEPLKRTLREDLRALLRGQGATAIVVSHDLPDAVAVADDLLIMREGRLRQAGALGDVIAAPADVEVAQMLGYVTLLDGELHADTAVEVGVGMLGVHELGDLPASGPVRVMAHPQALLAVPAGQGMGSGVRGPVTGAVPDGPQFRATVRLGEREVTARWEWDLTAPAAGTMVEIIARPGTLRPYPLSAASPAHTGPDAPNGGAPNGGAPNGGASDGGASDGGALSGGALSGGALDGGASDGEAPNGGALDGGALNGDAPDGEALNGDAESDVPEADAAPAPAPALAAAATAAGERPDAPDGGRRRDDGAGVGPTPAALPAADPEGEG